MFLEENRKKQEQTHDVRWAMRKKKIQKYSGSTLDSSNQLI